MANQWANAWANHTTNQQWDEDATIVLRKKVTNTLNQLQEIPIHLKKPDCKVWSTFQLFSFFKI